MTRVDDVDADHAASYFYQVKYLRNGHEFIGFADHLGLGQAKVLRRRPNKLAAH